ncbi:MAG: peptide ABC transporter substrate-binding protein [Chloroflexi bacterium]|nr:peptide ABC transporter substrate-binding protein [Chloroflexota bacterium]
MKTFTPLVILTILTLCTACAEPTIPPTPTLPPPTPSPTPEPKILTVCLPDEPDSLYFYGTKSLVAQHIWQAIYDGPLDNGSYAYQPVILTRLPSIANGDATITTVFAQTGDHVLGTNGELTDLAPGTTVQGAGGDHVIFDGTPILMQQMVVTFTLRSDLYWSDGTPLTVNDSVFSFAIASDSSTPTDKTTIERTASYRAEGVHTVIWTGIPGFLDQTYFLNFWHPLPLHVWGSLSAAELLNADISTQQPIGWGPFILHKWVAGDHITVVRNPIYFRTTEGLPYIDQITFRFIPDPTQLAEELLTGRCDMVTHDGADAVSAILPAQSHIEALSTHDTRWELLAFGISPNQNYNRPDFFEDVRVRQAIALCIDRDAVANQVLGPSGRVLHNYLPPEHSLYAGDTLTTWGYASTAGQTLLASAGWYDANGDGVREAHNIPGIIDGTPFQITYHTTNDPLRVQTAQLVQSYLAGCGINVSLHPFPPETLFAPGPEGVLFGQQFDLAQFSWHAVSTPLCDLFLSDQMPVANNWYKPNVTGFLDDEYDTACGSALNARPDSEEYVNSHIQAQHIFSERLPVLPLFQRLKTTLIQTLVIGLIPDSSHPSELWNIEQVDLKP